MERTEESPERKLAARFGTLPLGLISAAIDIYGEVVKWHETSIRLSASQFCAGRQNPELLRKMVGFLLMSDFARDIEVPLPVKFWLVEELGGKRGWARLKFRQPKRAGNSR